MARIYGTIESLKSLKSELKNRGISRFNSVREINDFLSNYNSEKLEIINDTKKELENEFSETSIHLKQRILNKTEIITFETEKLDNQIFHLKKKINLIENEKDKNYFKNIISNIKVYFTKNQLNYILNNKTTLINSPAKNVSQKIKKDEHFINEYTTDKQGLTDKRVIPKIEKLEYTLKVLENSKNLISGAIGENLVTKEIAKLPDDFVLINDFNLSFSTPIYFKKQNKRIHSIQVDHLLISKAGIFILETKNWSKSSVNSINLRSPIEQIERFGFALYVYISENVSLKNHHWGEKKVPIRKVIVMINNKPRAKFKFVTVKLLGELNDYINYFEPVLTDSEMNKIINKLT
jgi:hypothetical protein